MPKEKPENRIVVKLYDELGEICADTKEAHKIYRKLLDILKVKKNTVVVSFTRVRIMPNRFMEVAFGQLLKHWEPKELSKRLSITSKDEDLRYIYQQVMSYTWKALKANPEKKGLSRSRTPSACRQTKPCPEPQKT